MAHFEVDFLSYSLGRSVPFVAVVPSAAANDLSAFRKNQYRDLPLYPSLYLLHGSLDDHMSWARYTSIERYAEERQIAVFMMAGENKGYLNRGHERFYDFVAEELPSFCERMFPVSTRKEDRFIAGLSMGGFGAFYHGLSQPELYGAIGSFSGPLCEPLPGLGKRMPLDILKDDIAKGAAIPPMYLTIGNKDFLYKDNLRFLAFCQENKIPVRSEIVKGYGHEWRFWDLAVLRFLDWLPRSDAYAGAPRRI